MNKHMRALLTLAALLGAETLFAACWYSVTSGSSCYESPSYGCGSDCNGWRCSGQSQDEFCTEGSAYETCWNDVVDTVCTHYTGKKWGWPICITCTGDTAGQSVTNTCSKAVVSGACQ